MALFDGFDIFGLTETCNTGDHPRDTQTNSFNGLNGVGEVLLVAILAGFAEEILF